MRCSVLAVVLLVPLVLEAGCAGGDSVGDTFQNLGGAGGGAGSGGQGGMGAQASSGASGGSTSSSSSSSTSSSSTTSSSASSSSTTTGTGTTCVNGVDEKEPNDSEATAQNLGSIEDDDSTGDSMPGVIAGAGDVDWFKYVGEDTFGYSVDPTREFLANGFQLRICKFIQCKENNNPDFGGCPNETTSAVSPGGLAGCCGTFGFSLDLSCSSGGSLNDDATVYIRIDSPAGEDCAPYTVNYHF